MNRVLTVLILFGVSACASYNDKPRISYSKEVIQDLHAGTIYIKVSPESEVVFRGYVSQEIRDLGAPNSMTYPGNNGGVFLASIFVHAAVAESVQANREKGLQEKASQVLTPYRPFLEGVTNISIAERALPALGGKDDYQFEMYHQEAVSDGWMLESVPVYYMTQDQSTIILKNAVRLRSLTEPSKIVYKNLVEIHYSLDGDGGAESVWGQRDGKYLVDKTVDLFSESIRLAVDDVAGRLTDLDGKDKTFHYFRGGEKVYQRGRRVRQSCGHMVVRTLRGWLKSISTVAASKTDCSPALASKPG